MIKIDGMKDLRTLLDFHRLTSLRKCVISTLNLPGDNAVFGVYKGGDAKLIAHYDPKTPLHLFDTFTGLPEDDISPGGHHHKGDFADTSLESVKAYLNNPNAVYHVGFFPETAVDGLKFKMVHLDMDSLQSTRAAFQYLIPRMVSGAKICCDDMGWKNCPGIKIAIDEFNLKYTKSCQYQAVIDF